MGRWRQQDPEFRASTGDWVRYDDLVGLDPALARERLGVDLLECLADDYRSRLNHWGVGEPEARATQGRRLPLVRLGGELLAWCVVAGGFLLWLVENLWLAIAVCVPLAIVLCVLGLVHRRTVYVRLSVIEQSCPRCGYDLRASPRPFPAAECQGEDPGPSRCSECGLKWPLVPPHR